MTLLGKTAGLIAAALTITTLASGTTATGATAPTARSQDERPLIIGHRGASGYRPEHTLASYDLAIRMGADYVEPDLVSTKDGVLVARHENEIGSTTDVADHPEFASRKTTKTVDGVAITGWFTEDFTLAELKALRAKERVPAIRPQNARYDGRFEVPTLDEVLDLVARRSKELHRTIGVYPETKHPTYFQSIGLPLEGRLVATLKRHHLDRPGAKVLIQSFETANLRELDKLTDLPLVQLVDAAGAPYDLKAKGDPRTYADLVTPAGLRDIKTYADGIGAAKSLVIPRDTAGNALPPTELVAQAHATNLFVHVWTLRDENQFMALNWRIGTDPNAKGNARAEDQAFFDAGVDGIFTDNPDTGYDARADWLGTSLRQAG